MFIDYNPLPGPFGVEICDIDLSADNWEEILSEIIGVFYQHQLIVMREQTLDLHQFDRFTRNFGNQRPHCLDHLPMQGHPTILMLSDVFENGRQIGLHEDPANSATIVYAARTPVGRGAPTCLSDMSGAYDALPESTKRKIDDLIVVHHLGNRDDQKRNASAVHHPLVMRHPAMGCRFLTGVAGSSSSILGMPDDEAIDLLRELAAHATKPEFTTEYDYAQGDVAAWDAYSTLHKAPIVPKAHPEDGHARLLWRVDVTGTSPLLASGAEKWAA